MFILEDLTCKQHFSFTDFILDYLEFSSVSLCRTSAVSMLNVLDAIKIATVVSICVCHLVSSDCSPYSTFAKVVWSKQRNQDMSVMMNVATQYSCIGKKMLQMLTINSCVRIKLNTYIEGRPSFISSKLTNDELFG